MRSCAPSGASVLPTPSSPKRPAAQSGSSSSSSQVSSGSARGASNSRSPQPVPTPTNGGLARHRRAVPAINFSVGRCGCAGRGRRVCGQQGSLASAFCFSGCDGRRTKQDAAACIAQLRGNHVEAEIVPAPPAPLADCEIVEPVRLSSIGLTNGATIDLPNRPILDYAFAITFAEFAWDCHGDARLGHRRARDRRLLMSRPEPASERQSEPTCQGHRHRSFSDYTRRSATYRHRS
jgi:hypothetical protein